MNNEIAVRRSPVLARQGSITLMAQRACLSLGEATRDTLALDDFLDLHLHHFDGERSEAVWLKLKDSRDPRRAPFYYQAIRSNAAESVSVDFDDLAPWDTDIPATPILIFSIGRCGSTLFSKLTEAAGLPTWSEPDTFTNLAWPKKIALDEGRREQLTRVALNALAFKARQSDQATHFVVKMRSEVTRICASINRVAPGAISFFLVRDPTRWARSFHSHFKYPPRKSAMRLEQMTRSAREARQSGMAIEVIDYDEMVQNPEPVFRRLCEISGRPFSSTTLSQIMAEDSQKGTTISKGSGRSIPDGFDDAFAANLAEFDARLLDAPPKTWLDL